MRQPPNPRPRPWIPVLLIATACGPSGEVPASWGDDDAGDDAQADPGGTASEATSATSHGGSESSGSESSGDPPSNFIAPADVGENFRCDTFAQDCPAGSKCMPWANDGGGAWNATGCFPIVPDPDQPGEPCTVEGSGVSGLDTCDLGVMCWDVNPETNEGTCVAMCEGDHANPICSDPDTVCSGRIGPLCLPTCCPLEQDCPEGRACYPSQQDFECAPDVSGEQGAYGDPCEFINVCKAGLACVNPDLFPDCPSGGCCSEYCTVGSSHCETLHADLECVPWFAEGEVAPPLEHVGICGLPV